MHEPTVSRALAADREKRSLGAGLARAVRLALLATTALTAPFATGCAAPLVPPRQGLAMRDVSFPVRQLRYPSGLQVIAERDDRTKLAGIFLVVGAGASSDPLGKEGLAHFIEHLTFRSRPYGKSSMQRMLERAGAGAWNAYTELDATVYYQIGAATSLPERLRLEGTRMLGPVVNVTPETLTIELEVVRSELRQRGETGYVGEVIGALQGAIFPAGHPYARPVIGTHESLSAIGGEDIAAFLRAHYRPDNMTLVIVGDVDLASIDKVVSASLPPELVAATPAAAHAPPRARLAPRAPEPPDPPPGTFERRTGAVATPEIWIGWSMPRAFGAESALATIAVRTASDELEGASHEDQDIIGTSTSVVHGTEASMLLCRVVLAQGSHPERSLDHVLNRLYNVWGSQGDVTSAQLGALAFAKRQWGVIVDMVQESESLVDRGLARATSTHFSGDPTLYSRQLASVAKLNASEVAAYAARYLNRERARAMIFTPPSNDAALPPALPVGSSALEDEGTPRVLVDAARLRSGAPGPGASSFIELTLQNGISVILGARPGLPTVAAGLLVQGGFSATSDQSAARLAALLSKPRETWHGSPSVFGGSISHQTTSDATRYLGTSAAGNVGILLAIMAEQARSMHVDSMWIAPFKRDYLPYLRIAEQRPQAAATRSFFAALFGDHPYGKMPTADDLAASSADAATRWIDATFTPQNTTLVVIGEIDPKQVEAIIHEQFGGWRDEPSSVAAIGALEPEGGPRAAPSFLVTHRPGATQAELRYGCVLPSVRVSKDDVRHDLIATLIQEQLGRALRQRLGVTYGIQARGAVLRGGTAYLDIQGAVDRVRVAASIAELRKELEALAKEPVPDAELAWIKLRLAQRRGTANVANEELTLSVLGQRRIGLPASSLDTFADDLAAVTAEEVQRDMQRCAAGRPTLSIVGDEPSIRAAIKEVWP